MPIYYRDAWLQQQVEHGCNQFCEGSNNTHTPMTLTLPAGSNGTYSRSGIPPGDYILRVIARDPVRGDRKVIRNRLGVHSDDASDPYCTTYLINRGWRVEGRNLTVEFTATGIASGFECALDRMEHIECKDYAHMHVVAKSVPPSQHCKKETLLRLSQLQLNDIMSSHTEFIFLLYS